MPLVYRMHITRAGLREQSEALFVFGDNLQRRGLGGQAKEMRGEPNAVGIPTKRAPAMNDAAFLGDNDLPQIIIATAAEWSTLARHLLGGGAVIVPTMGIGTGLAQLPTRAPLIYRYYQDMLNILGDIQC